MKKLVLTLAVFCCAAVLSVNAADEKKPEGKEGKKQMTDEQKKVYQEMVGKYDKNGDKKLDGDERKAMSAEDKEKMAKAGIGGKKKD